MRANAVVRELVGTFGGTLVAVMGNAKNTSTVRRWMSGKEQPPEIDRLRVALEVVLYMRQVEGEDVINAWFRGLNHMLGEAAAIVIADEPPELARNAVMGAASAFLAH